MNPSGKIVPGRKGNSWYSMAQRYIGTTLSNQFYLGPTIPAYIYGSGGSSEEIVSPFSG